MRVKPSSTDGEQRQALSAIEAARGTSALIVRGIEGIAQISERLHAAISQASPPLSLAGSKPRQTRGITRMVYATVRGITRGVGWSIDRSLALAQNPRVQTALNPVLGRLARQLKLKSAAPYRESVLAALNGVLGDSLAAMANPLAIPMQLRSGGQRLDPGSSPSTDKLDQKRTKLLILVHGLCMNDLQWLRDGHDHGAALAERSGWYPVYLHYNSGRSVPENGKEFADLLERTCSHWPIPIEELAIVGHSMGGLLARSACHHGLKSGHAWVQSLRRLITLGTPHAGAPLERLGRGVDRALELSPYTAPFAKLGLIRSQGIQDLRFGRITAPGEIPQWPAHVALYTLAATKQKASPSKPQAKPVVQAVQRLIGDGLVPVKSALGQGDQAANGLPLQIPATRQAVIFETDHFQMLGSQQVFNVLVQWLDSR